MVPLVPRLSAIVSLRAPRPQPDLDYYGAGELALFRDYSRDSFRAAFGVEAPAYDPTRRIKTWFDSSADASDPENIAIYRTVGRDKAGNWVLKQLAMNASEAAVVNLTGAIRYPTYTPEPTMATRGSALVNPEYLSLEAEARALMADVGGTALVDEGASAVFPVIYPPQEARRMWAVLIGGRPWNAGLLRRTKWFQGVGAPGQWDLSQGEPKWVAATAGPTGEDDMRPPREMPCRELLANERIEVGLLGLPQIARTDRAGGRDTGFTAGDREMLRRVFEVVTK